MVESRDQVSEKIIKHEKSGRGFGYFPSRAVFVCRWQLRVRILFFQVNSNVVKFDNTLQCSNIVLRK